MTNGIEHQTCSQGSAGPVRVLCLGNELACDDGVGIRVWRVLDRLRLPDGVVLVRQPQVGLDLIDSLHPDESLIVVDASCSGVAPGTCTVMDGPLVTAESAPAYCCHAMGLSEVFRVARALTPPCVPKEVVVVVVEAEVLDRFGCDLSEPVRAAIPDAVQSVLTRLGASRELLSQGQREAHRVMAWRPSPSDVLRL